MKSKLASFDYYVQLILLVLIGLSLFGTLIDELAVLIAVGIWIFFGVWQTIMSLIYATNYQDADRIRHLLLMVIAGLGFGLLALAVKAFGLDDKILTFFFLLALIVSIWIGVWVFRLSDKARKTKDKNLGYKYEDLLDEGEIEQE